MKKVYQTKHSVRLRGNCWRAAIASILEIGIDSMPPFEDTGHRCLEETRIWLNANGYSLFRYDANNPPASYAIAVGKSPRHEDVNHAIVVKDGVFQHDPYMGSNEHAQHLDDIQEYFAICKSDDSNP
jgi:hypothetical protein